MSFESDTLTVLGASSALTALCPSASIFFDEAPQNQQMPYITCYLVSTVPNATTDCGASGAARLDTIRIQVDTHASSKTSAKSIAEKVRLALEASSSIRYFLANEFSGYEDTAEQHSRVQEFSCWYQSTS